MAALSFARPREHTALPSPARPARRLHSRRRRAHVPAAVGSSFSPVNPFQVLIAQHVAELPQGSAAGFSVVPRHCADRLDRGDLLAIPRQAKVLAYYYGAGLTELITPTNGALMAILAAAEVRFEHWIKFTLPLFAILFALGFVAVAIAIGIGLQ